MYHRYLPTENGQYRKVAVPEPAAPPAAPAAAQRETAREEAPRSASAPEREIPAARNEPSAPSQRVGGGSPAARGIDPGDLLLLLVLLFLLSEGGEDASPTILTLALSLFLS